ncbi:hypothetical protein TIFTF001_035165 [Ficus carica]|uniref:Gag-pol polyprotein n=1 Tax=Ficus carica TaxID=3494 RepID=A0AA88J9Q5_FICCA|nr:hypothetical protein TIFTF001_035165 [Ficus carica]
MLPARVSRGITLKRRTTGGMRVIAMTIQCVHNVERNHEWGMRVIAMTIQCVHNVERNQELYPKGQTNNSGQNSKQFGKNKRKGNATGQVKIEGPSIAQGRLEAPEPQARIYAYTRGDAEAGTSHVVIGQISIATYDAIVLIDYGATHSFMSMAFAQKLGRDLNTIKLQDYDVILGMDLLIPKFLNQASIGNEGMQNVS